MLLDKGDQGLDPQGPFRFFRSDRVARDVPSVLGVPFELHALHCKDSENRSQLERATR